MLPWATFLHLTYSWHKQNGPEGDFSLGSKVCLGHWLLGILREHLVEAVVLLIINLLGAIYKVLSVDGCSK